MSAQIRVTARDGRRSEELVRERFGLEWGTDVIGIMADGLEAEFLSEDRAYLTIKLGAMCSRDDVEGFIAALSGESVMKGGA